jgi:CRP-like cAMP-binding protein
MKIDKAKQTLAQFEIARKLDRAEKERARARLLRGIEALNKHDFTVLSKDEFAEQLAHHLCRLDPNADQEEAGIILEGLNAACGSSEADIRDRALMALCVFSDYALENDFHAFIEKIAAIITQWLKKETEYLSGFAGVCKQIQKISLKFLSGDFQQEAIALVERVNQIQSGSLEKCTPIKGMVAKIQENIAQKDILARLTDIYLDGANAQSKDAGALLKNLGKRAVIFLLNTLMRSETRDERLLLLRLIPEIGRNAVPVFEECLKKNPPWYVIRNIVCMIGDSGDPSLFTLISPYLRYPDIRVQQQIIVCIRKIGGKDMKKRLLTALSEIYDELKVLLVMELGRYEGNDVASVLLDLFERRKDFSASVADELLLKLCIALKAFPCQRTVKDLNGLIKERRKLSSGQDRICIAAEEALAVVAPKVRHEAKSEANALNELSFDSDPILEEAVKNKYSDLLEEASSLAGKGNIGKATELVFAEAIRVAGEGDFTSAELLRDGLLDINPMALTQALMISEAIEREKGSAITGHHIEIWNALYEKMTTEEFNALHYAMKRETYSPEEIIIRSGEMDHSLFFINSGFVHLSCQCGRRETFLKRLQPGEVVGVGPFFAASVWTVSLVSQSVSQIHVLERGRFLTLKQKFPDLEEKLHAFCQKYDLIPWLLQMTGEDRREFARYALEVTVESVLLDPFGMKEKHPVKGQIIDISRGGFSFTVGVLTEERAKALLGRQIISEVHLGYGDPLKCFGKIVGVRFSDDRPATCSIHISLYSMLEQKEIARCMKR